MEGQKKKPIYVICECAVLVAMAVALSYVEIQIGVLGGSIDFVMVPLFVLCYRNGAKYGIPAGLVFGFLKCLLGGGIGYGLPSILLDYVLAYGACGIAGFFRGHRRLTEVAVLAGCAARFAVHFLSGVTIYKILVPTEVEAIGVVFSNPVVYSLVYNAVYMLPNTVIAVAVMALLRAPLRKMERL